MRGTDVEAAKRAVYKYLGAAAAQKILRSKPLSVRRYFQATFAQPWVMDAQQKAGQRRTGVVNAALWDALDKAGAIDAFGRYLIEQAQPPPIVFPVPTGGGAVTVCQGLHETAGINGNWAIDFCAQPGAPIVTCEDGWIVRLSGHSPAEDTWDSQGVYGWSVHWETRAGYRYFVTHLGKRGAPQPGDRVPRGTILGWVGDQKFRPDHTHYGVTSPMGPTDAKKRITAVSKAKRAAVA
jgi:murein DD-endopeptidase MepM/ murein hydrolase activator NlpD